MNKEEFNTIYSDRATNYVDTIDEIKIVVKDTLRKIFFPDVDPSENKVFFSPEKTALRRRAAILKDRNLTGITSIQNLDFPFMAFEHTSSLKLDDWEHGNKNVHTLMRTGILDPDYPIPIRVMPSSLEVKAYFFSNRKDDQLAFNQIAWFEAGKNFPTLCRFTFLHDDEVLMQLPVQWTYDEPNTDDPFVEREFYDKNRIFCTTLTLKVETFTLLTESIGKIYKLPRAQFGDTPYSDKDHGFGIISKYLLEFYSKSTGNRAEFTDDKILLFKYEYGEDIEREELPGSKFVYDLDENKLLKLSIDQLPKDPKIGIQGIKYMVQGRDPILTKEYEKPVEVQLRPETEYEIIAHVIYEDGSVYRIKDTFNTGVSTVEPNHTPDETHVYKSTSSLIGLKF